MPETGSDICSQKYSKFPFWPAEYLRTALDKSHSVSHHLSYFLQRCLIPYFTFLSDGKDSYPVFQVLLHPFFHHLSVEMDSVPVKIYFKDVFSNISHSYTCISAAYTQRHARRLGDQTQEQQGMLQDSQDLFLPDCLVLVPDTSPQPEIWWSWMFRRILWKAANITLKIKKSMRYYF